MVLLSTWDTHYTTTHYKFLLQLSSIWLSSFLNIRTVNHCQLKDSTWHWICDQSIIEYQHMNEHCDTMFMWCHCHCNVLFWTVIRCLCEDKDGWLTVLDWSLLLRTDSGQSTEQAHVLQSRPDQPRPDPSGNRFRSFTCSLPPSVSSKYAEKFPNQTINQRFFYCPH